MSQASHPTERVFAFTDPVDFLNFELRERQRRDSRFSLRAWARQVGYKNPSYLSYVLSRKRRLKVDFAGKLASDLELKGRSLKYFELLVLNQNASTKTETQTYRKLLGSIRPRKQEAVNQVSLETFAAVSDWYHGAILEMTELEGFDMSVRAIHQRLGGRVDLRTVRGAIERLVRAGFLRRNEQGKLVRGKPGANETHAPIPPAAVISYHRQMGLLGVEAVEKQPHAERDFYATTLAFRRENYKRAQEIIATAHKELLKLAEHGKGEDIYQLNTQFFRLTTKKASRAQR